jgi:methylenetetrahydrofolate dehydrogenase (NADP+) / methenyltetrahydrofolate cyclohydrolase
MPRILDGVAIRDQILTEAKPRVEHLARTRRPPGLAVVLAGADPASEIYVRNKIKACAELGIYSEKHTPPATATTEELLALVESLNRNPAIDGILVQMPLPPHVDAARVLHAVDAAKDADGFHPYNVGQLVANAPAPRACTPAGVMELLRRYNIATAGARAVVVGRSDIVGKPMALLLLHAHATVTVCHSQTRHLPEECRRADILVAALGRPAFLTADFIGEQATVVDVGINRVSDPAQAQAIYRGDAKLLEAFARKGSAVLGDAHPLDVAAKASAYTPVPGGVGPLTIAMLMLNTIQLAERRLA